MALQFKNPAGGDPPVCFFERRDARVVLHPRDHGSATDRIISDYEGEGYHEACRFCTSGRLGPRAGKHDARLRAGPELGADGLNSTFT